MAQAKPGKRTKLPVKKGAARRPRPKEQVVAGICAGLVLGCIAIYGQTLWHGFVSYDDNRFVVENAQVQSGLSWATAAWAFTNHVEYYFMPLSWLSHAMDCQLYGMWGGGHHLTSLIIHTANALLLFWVLLRLTGALWPSDMVAALFAVHPLHVESVAWAAERKDVLSTLFWCLTLLAYTHYAAKPAVRRYLPVAALYAVALMSKPMVVTLPCLMLLLDYWPLGRIRFDTPNCDMLRNGARLVLEKVPLFALAAVDSAATFVLQRAAQPFETADDRSLSLRVGNALVSYAFFLFKSIVPTGLSVVYPWPVAGFPLWQVAGATVLMLAVTTAALATARRRPYLIVGWLWYLGLMAPTVQVLQRHTFPYARADRYTYCALIGIAVMVVWGAADLAAAWRLPRRAVATVSGAVLVVLTVCAGVQAGYWHDSGALFRHAVAVGQESGPAFYNLGVLAMNEGHDDEAREYLKKALVLDPKYVNISNNLGVLAAKQGRYDEANEYLRTALELEPENVNTLINLGLVAMDQGRYGEATDYLEKVLDLDPKNAFALDSLGSCLMSQGHNDEAEPYFRKALALDPQFVDAMSNLGAALAKMGRQEEANGYIKKAAKAGRARMVKKD